jgi:predicted nucleotidyltransferase
MTLRKKLKEDITKLLTNVITKKLENYNPESDHKPFHYRLIGKDRYAMFSFIQSMNTTFGMSLFEQMAKLIAEDYGFHAERQFVLQGKIDENTERLIHEIHFNLRKTNTTPDIKKTTNKIREIVQVAEKPEKHPDSTVDLYVKKNDEQNFFDITSAKPNMKEFVALKLKLLNWIALSLSQDKKAKVYARLAIPYNPYYPEPYERWTSKGLYDQECPEILVGEEFWNFLADDNIYQDLLNLVEGIGNELRPLIDNFFAQWT